jgi:phosphatidylinositol kinase/protein kinase (PI-3  family)
MNVAVVQMVRSQCLEAAVQRLPVPVARLAVSRIQRVVSIETRVCVCATSAYGRHPGWKLLPILIKSNDDLRQD